MRQTPARMTRFSRSWTPLSSSGPLYPPVGPYLLTQFPERIPWLATTFLVDGPTPVYYWRSETGNYENPPEGAGGCDGGDRDRYRAQSLARLTEFSYPRVTLDPYPEIRIEWRNEDEFRSRVLEAVAKQQDDFRRSVTSVRESRRLLTPEEAPSRVPRIEIVIRDRRSDRSTQLPIPLASNEAVAVRPAFSKPLD